MTKRNKGSGCSIEEPPAGFPSTEEFFEDETFSSLTLQDVIESGAIDISLELSTIEN